MPIGAALLAYNVYFFGSVFGGYGGSSAVFDWSLAGFRAGAAGLLFSPGRGIFFYFPFVGVALLLILRQPSLLRQGLPAALAVSIVSSTALFSFYSEWHGGWCVGPRYLTEVQPLILILAGIAWQSLSFPVQWRLGMLCFGILLPYSIFIQAVGSYSVEPLYWSADAEKDYAHFWNFRDNPIARGLWLPPDAQRTACAPLRDNPPTESVPGVSFVVDPAEWGRCDPQTIAKVAWNVSIPGVERVDVFVLGEKNNEKLVVGWNEVVGSIKTGAWVSSGTGFVLRDADGGKQLAKVYVAIRNRSEVTR
jgi:hypothetical protein